MKYENTTSDVTKVETKNQVHVQHSTICMIEIGLKLKQKDQYSDNKK